MRGKGAWTTLAVSAFTLLAIASAEVKPMQLESGEGPIDHNG
jgi:hypothetical protein